MYRENIEEISEVVTISEEEAGERLDKILASRYQGLHSRTYFQHLIQEEKILLNGAPVLKRIRPKVDDEVEIFFALTPEIDLVPEPIPLSILFEDEYLIAVNKPAGLVVHPAPGNWQGTFVNALIYHCRHLLEGEGLRPGIVHRLDKETTGVLVAAKTSLSQQRLITLFTQREVEKIYLAICLGNPGSGTIREPIGRHPIHRQKMAILKEGREAVTHFKTVAYNRDISLVEIRLETGRTHQIRVHFQHRGFPILGDPIYGKMRVNQTWNIKRQMLHAQKLAFSHPINGNSMIFTAPPPKDMRDIMNATFGKEQTLKF